MNLPRLDLKPMESSTSVSTLDFRVRGMIIVRVWGRGRVRLRLRPRVRVRVRVRVRGGVCPNHSH